MNTLIDTPGYEALLRKPMPERSAFRKAETQKRHSQAGAWEREEQEGEQLEFTLSPDLEAHEPPETRGLKRDEVRLLVSRKADDAISHVRFRDIADFLNAGDVLVINTSGTLPASLPALREDGMKLELHLSTYLPADIWAVELRLPTETGTLPFREIKIGERLELPGGASATILAPYLMNRSNAPKSEGSRLWLAVLELPTSLLDYLGSYGKPIRYGYIKKDCDISFYQTVYANEPGSAEMPSAGRAFTSDIITQLVVKGVTVAPLVLHTGVASLEDHEPPYEEFYRVPLQTARAVNQAHADGKRVIAVGTTVVRALETVTDASGITHPGEGYTKLIITTQRGVKAVDGILTGWHEPKATHLMMLGAIANREHLNIAYQAAIENTYLWHEFGDLHLILP
jgi:S-adenosylmethionine:tRNA ribosyltransferase-isomerase